ncbi:hypothetical protein [Actinoallomurus iriomotensis]|uniref:Uncharacterized protein n=1 Tax=Actinoallomurus iriomotensis TaxID=478107 RepID=A0A9W6RZV6_9ACTN|nr:hypothetical protein [Actinoallomurus iriomotensis]GLY84721.1 hypothetical protein Airi02_026500 [Actinoallomurus iriomotensis]
MATRTALTAGAIGAVTAALLVASVVPDPVGWIAAAVVTASAVPAAVTVTRRPMADTVRRKRTPAEGIVDCAGQSLDIGDSVRAGDGFDGPMELGFGRGVVVKVGRGKAHVRFNDIPGQVHAVTPGTLRRL